MKRNQAGETAAILCFCVTTSLIQLTMDSIKVGKAAFRISTGSMLTIPMSSAYQQGVASGASAFREVHPLSQHIPSFNAQQTFSALPQDGAIGSAFKSDGAAGSIGYVQLHGSTIESKS
jgi:hypothetical protein